MRFPFTIFILTGAMLLGAAMAGANETQIQKLEREIRNLELQKLNLNKSLIEARLREETKTKTLKEIKEYLALVGIDIHQGGRSKLLDAATDYQIARENLEKLEGTVSNLIPLVQDYLRTAVASNPEARKAVEVKIRELEVALGQRQQPKRKIEQGTTQEARIVTIDSDTGTIVVSAGSDAGLSVGSRFRIERSGTPIGDAIVAETRPHISGLLIQSLTNPEVPVQAGDFAKVITVNSD
jgi:hypothetical protein